MRNHDNDSSVQNSADSIETDPGDSELEMAIAAGLAALDAQYRIIPTDPQRKIDRAVAKWSRAMDALARTEAETLEGLASKAAAYLETLEDTGCGFAVDLARDVIRLNALSRLEGLAT